LMVDWANSLITINLTGFPDLFHTSFFWLAEAPSEAELGPLVLASVLLSLIVIYFSAKVGGELCSRVNLPPVLGELV
ncbi:hypothetical protein, partial [Haemophilus parainfluenzae]|uniref:hypothetical protein n=1 Tax=Haemophilus parainfluenzae TaxID=729 RepID=UPI001CEE0322